MRNQLTYIAIFIGLMIFTACEDFLDKKPSALLTADQVFGDEVQFKKFHDDIYTYLHYWPGDWACQSFGGLGRIAYSSFEGATDLAEASRDVAGTNAGFNLGNWSKNAYGMQVELIWPWNGAYAGIRRCNVVLEKVDAVPNLTADVIRSYKGEALFLRAFFYSELIKRYGGVPYITKSLKVDDDMDLAREPYDTCVAKIVKDLDQAYNLLSLEYPSGAMSGQATSDLGRPTKGAALALKAKVLLYAASPLNTEPYNVSIGNRNPELYFIEQPNTEAEKHEKWVIAAKAAYDVIKFSKDYSQYALSDSSNYRNIFYGEATNREVIFTRVDGNWSFSGGKAITGWIGFSDFGASKGYGGSAGTYPTQNFVDMFEMEDGTIPILGYENGDGTKPIINPTSGYNDQNMWKNRDARLKHIVLCNQDKWQDRRVEMWFDKTNPSVSGSEMKDARDYCTTGYLCKKMWPEDLRAGGSSSIPMNWIWMRYTDVILWYAEAMNWAYGPDIDALGAGLTARQALNKIRNRLNPSNPNHRNLALSYATKEAFHERLMNERAIEFIYEEQRWWDVLRYKKGVETFGVPIYGVRNLRTSTAPLTFEITRRKLENRTFQDYMHVYPIPYSELEKSPKLKQNLGW